MRFGQFDVLRPLVTSPDIPRKWLHREVDLKGGDELVAWYAISTDKCI
jgi:hypothetical protein